MRSLVRGVVVAGLLATGVGPAAAAVVPLAAVPGVVAALAAADPTPSQIHVDLSADIPEPKSGDVITYTLRVQNASATDYPHMNVFQLLPTGFHVTESTPKAAVRPGGPEWTANVPAGGTAVFSVTATAGTVAEIEHARGAAARQRSNNPSASATPGAADAKTPPATSTFTTVACARIAAVGPALACGSAKQTLSDSPDGAGGGTRWQPGLLGLGFAAVLFAGLRGYLRKRSARRVRAE